MKAKAAVFMGAEKDFEVRSFDICPAPEGYAKLELIASGVCGTDLHFHNGKLHVEPPTVIGHEFVGEIKEISEKDSASYGLCSGDKVIVDIAVPCGKCPLCLAGDDANCVNMKVTNGGSIEIAPYLYGGYAEVNYSPVSSLIKIPESIDPLAAAVFACPGPTVIHSIRLAKKAGVDHSKIKTAVVQGLGPVGLFAVCYLKALGVEKVFVISTGKNGNRKKAAISLGADCVFELSNESEEQINEHIKKESSGLGADLCIESSGAPRAIVQGMDLLRNRGVYLVPGQYSASGGIEIQPQLITFKALHIIGSSQYSVCDVKDYLVFLESNPSLYEPIKSLASLYKIDEINEAFDNAKKGHAIKTVLIK
ncbi:MAG: hypothetical protein E7623_00320 [Ruminococcaceae bacterium]|nr:hypothetical protein [Oscillospiraceae bacterium]